MVSVICIQIDNQADERQTLEFEILVRNSLNVESNRWMSWKKETN